MVEKEDDQVYEVLEKIHQMGGDIKKGTNETTKVLEKGKAKLVVVAKDVSPKEIIMHLAPLSKEKNALYVEVASKEELGASIGIDVPCASVAVTDPGEAKKEFLSFLEKLKTQKQAKKG